LFSWLHAISHGTGKMKHPELFALVRGLPDLADACREISGLIGLQKDGNPVTLSGIWIDSHLTRHPPVSVCWHGPAARRRSVIIAESFGVSGVWLLCRLESRSSGHLPDRHELTQGLLRASWQESDAVQDSLLIPVFPVDASPGQILATVWRLQASCPVLLPPVYQDPETGTLAIHDTCESGRGLRA